ncbi:hypothetical protein COLO4_15749 [Corchorus olitorius]|uniref:Uncharacterized protein n=1 Tax=Corchorus olitorius TaxID=93759 RepID=A0A1R3JLB5_9ROSI|nr:hypothetical protein COLO4_15749 [Corchorus olitorius]
MVALAVFSSSPLSSTNYVLFLFLYGGSLGSEGSLLRGSLGGFVSPNHGARQASSGTHGSGSKSVPSKSITGGGASFRNHVNSMVLRGKPVARALTYEDQSCEIISRFEGNRAGKSPYLQEGGLSENRRRDARFKGGYGMPVAARNGTDAESSKARKYKDNGGKILGPDVPNIEESSGETPLAVEANLLAKKLTVSESTPNIRTGEIGPILGQEIPGIGLSIVGSSKENTGLVNVGLKGQGLVAKGNDVTKIHHQVSKNTATYSTDESYDPAFPFVFGAGGSKTRKVRKWKKQARVSELYSFDMLCHEPPLRVGSKRSTGGLSQQGDSHGGIFKKSKEVDMEIETQEEAILGRCSRVPLPSRRCREDFIFACLEYSPT